METSFARCQSSSELQKPQSVSSSLSRTSDRGKISKESGVYGRNETQSQRLESCDELSVNLSRCGLLQYLDILLQNGFDNWDTVLDIQERDLEAMEFKLGHRRRLQRQILNYSSHTQSPRLSLSQQSSTDKVLLKPMDEAGTRVKPLKRKYTRRPIPDTNAPKKPKTGYVSFSNHLRSLPEVAVMPFDALTRHVGHSWQSLGSDGRKVWEDRAENEMSSYLDCLETYKRSKNYTDYQAYLANFRDSKQGQASNHRETVDIQEGRLFSKPDGVVSSKEVMTLFFRHLCLTYSAS
jgi:hypothetical protein